MDYFRLSALKTAIQDCGNYFQSHGISKKTKLRCAIIATFLAHFLEQFGIGIITPMLVFWIEEIDEQQQWVEYIVTSRNFAIVIGAVTLGYISDAIGYRLSLILLVTIDIGLLAVTSFANAALVMLFVQTCYGFFSPTIAAQSWMMLSVVDRDTYLGYFNAINQLGMLTGYITVGLLQEFTGNGIQLSCWIAISLGILTNVFALLADEINFHEETMEAKDVNHQPNDEEESTASIVSESIDAEANMPFAVESKIEQHADYVNSKHQVIQVEQVEPHIDYSKEIVKDMPEQSIICVYDDSAFVSANIEEQANEQNYEMQETQTQPVAEYSIMTKCLPWKKAKPTGAVTKWDSIVKHLCFMEFNYGMFNSFTATLFLVYVIEEMNFTPFHVSIMCTSIVLFVVFLMVIFYAKISKLYGTTGLANGCSIAMMVIYVVMAVSVLYSQILSVIAVVLAVTITNFGSPAIRSLQVDVVLEKDPGSQGFVMGFGKACFNIGNAIGPIIIMGLYRIHKSLPFCLMIILTILSIILSYDKMRCIKVVQTKATAD